MPKISVNRSFASREDLDNYVKNTFGADVENNRDITIEATKEVLEKLSLSESTTVYGVKFVPVEEAEVIADVNVDPANKTQ